MTPRYDIDLIIARYLSGEAAPEDIVVLSAWLGENPDNGDLLRQAKAYWDCAMIPVSAEDSSAGFDNILGRIRQRDGVSATEPMRAGKRQALKIIAGLAALFALALGGMIFYHVANPIETTRYSYNTGESISQFTLPDGTEVSLNKNSSISFSDRYSGSDRDVVLQGEAWFDVAHDPDHEFTVQMGDSRIVVLGTRFTARYSEDDNMVKASLIKGSMRFEAAQQNILLAPGNKLQYNRDTGEVGMSAFDPEIEVAWKDNLIRYKSMAFRDFIALLRNTYNSDIAMADNSLDDIRISGTIDARQSVEQILDMIKYAVPFSWERTNDAYILTPVKYSTR